MAQQNFPGWGAGKELQQTLANGETILAWATGKGGALLVATDRRAIIIKTGPAATGTWFGKKNASYGYQQITSVDLHTGIADGYVEISAGGIQQRNLGRVAQLTGADNVSPFNKWSEADFRRVVEVMRAHLYSVPTPSAPAVAVAPAQSIPEQIAALATLRDAGAITPAEYDAKKAELLARM